MSLCTLSTAKFSNSITAYVFGYNISITYIIIITAFNKENTLSLSTVSRWMLLFLCLSVCLNIGIYTVCMYSPFLKRHTSPFEFEILTDYWHYFSLWMCLVSKWVNASFLIIIDILTTNDILDTNAFKETNLKKKRKNEIDYVDCFSKFC